MRRGLVLAAGVGTGLLVLRRLTRLPQPTPRQLVERADLLEMAARELALIYSRGYRLWAYLQPTETRVGTYVRFDDRAHLQRYLDQGLSMAVFALHPRFQEVSEVRHLLSQEDWDALSVFQTQEVIFLGDITGTGQVLWGYALSFLLEQDLWPYQRRRP